MEAYVLFYSIIIFCLILLMLFLGIGELVLDHTKLIKEFKSQKQTYESLNLAFDKITSLKHPTIAMDVLGNKRIEEVTRTCSDKKLGQKLLWRVCIIVWYKEKSLTKLYEELRKVSGIFLGFLVLGISYTLLDSKVSIKSIHDCADVLKDSANHLIPIIEVFSLFLILLRIYAERGSLKQLLSDD